MTPIAPQYFAWRFQLIGLERSRSEECRKSLLASIGWPSAPPASVS